MSGATEPREEIPSYAREEKTMNCTLEDESDGCGTYYDIHCESCGDSYRTDGPDS